FSHQRLHQPSFLQLAELPAHAVQAIHRRLRAPLVRLDPRKPDEYKGWGRREDQEKRGKAVDRLEKTLEQAKTDAEKHSRQAVELHKAGELEKAVEEYGKALVLYPRYTEVYYNRGLARRKLDDIPGAIADYSRAIRLDPGYIPAYANRGFAYYKLGELDLAIADFERILELDPKNADARKSREVILKMRVGSRENEP
ncbi:MAG: tetratricopeptide repeat protein, partial [Planctomycetes bacterium]|nr:tetratricopeptide repeat protein [Planctomycetota bacterium]